MDLALLYLMLLRASELSYEEWGGRSRGVCVLRRGGIVLWFPEGAARCLGAEWEKGIQRRLRY